MTKKCDIDIVEQRSSVQRDLKITEMLNQGHQVSKFSKKLKKEQRMNKFFVQEEIKEK